MSWNKFIHFVGKNKIPLETIVFGLIGLAFVSVSLLTLALYWLSFELALAFLGTTLYGLLFWIKHYGYGAFGWTFLSHHVLSLHSDPQPDGTVRIVAISDTHNKVPKVPPGDILIHCGDFTYGGTKKEIKAFNEWLGTLPHAHKIVIAGNHDKDMMTSSKKLLTNCIYLENESIKIQGIQFYGSPYTPAIPGKTMAFNYHDRQTAHTIWQKIPQDVDILMTHGPPHQFLDRIIVGKHVGCPKLRQRVMQVQPKFHFFGHIHEGFGIQTYKDVTFVNCATVTLLYQPKHEAVVLDYVTNKR